MRTALLTSCISLAMAASHARAALVASDGFDSYAAGSQLESGADGTAGGTGLNGGAGFTGAYNIDDAAKSHADVFTQGLNYSGGNVSISGGVNSARFTGVLSLSTDFVTRSFAAESGPLYLSFLLRGSQTAADEDFLQIGFSGGAAGEPPISMGISGVAAGTLPDQFFIRIPAGSGNQVMLANPTFALDTTFLIVLKVTKTSGGNYNRLDLFLNPTTLTEPATATLGRTADSLLASLSNFRVRVARLDAGDSYLIDEVKVGTAYSDVVVPEPATSSLLLPGFVAGLLGMRKREAASA